MANQIDTDVEVRGENTKGFGQNKIVRVSGGRLYTAHLTDVYDVEVHYSDNGGTSWTLDNTFSETNARFISMCVSELGDVFVCYVIGSGTSHTVKVKKRDYSAGTWSEVLSEALTLYVSGSTTGVMICYNQGMNRLHAFWFWHVTSSSYIRISNKYSDNRGTSWTSGTDYDVESGAGPYALSIWGLDSSSVDSKVYCYIKNAKSNRHGIHRFNNVGVHDSWLYNRTYIPNGGASLVDSAGDFWQLYQDGNTECAIDKNGVRQKLIASNAHYFDYGMCAIGEDGDNNIFIIYTKNSDGKLYKRSSEDTFTDETALTTGAGDRPSCEQHSLGSSDELHYVYSSNA